MSTGELPAETDSNQHLNIPALATDKIMIVKMGELIVSVICQGENFLNKVLQTLLSCITDRGGVTKFSSGVTQEPIYKLLLLSDDAIRRMDNLEVGQFETLGSEFTLSDYGTVMIWLLS